MNRTLEFIKKSFQSKVPNGSINKNIKNEIEELYESVYSIPEIEILFERLDKKIIEEEIKKLTR